MAFFRAIHLLLLVLATCVYAADRTASDQNGPLPIEKALMIMENVPGGCSEDKIARLQKMWAQMQSATWIASELMHKHAGAGMPKPLKDGLWSYEGSSKHFSEGLRTKEMKDLAQASKGKDIALRRVLATLFHELTTEFGAPGSLTSQQKQLYCGDPLEYWDPDRIVEGAAPKTKHQKAKEQPLKNKDWYDPNFDYWYLATLQGGGALVKLAKDALTPNAPPESFCDHPKNHVLAISGASPNDMRLAQMISIPRSESYARNSVIILCPSFFNSEGEGKQTTLTTRMIKSIINRESINLLDPTAVEDKTHSSDVVDLEDKGLFKKAFPLSSMRPNWLALYRAMIWVQMASSMGSHRIWTKRMTKKPSPPGWNHIPPKDQFTVEDHLEVQSPDQCIVIAQYDVAFELSSLRESRAIKSPQNLAYFVLALYLWVELEGHQSWAFGEITDDEQYDPPNIAQMPSKPYKQTSGKTVPQHAGSNDPDEGPTNRGASRRRKRPLSDTSERSGQGGGSIEEPDSECDPIVDPEYNSNDDPYGEPDYDASNDPATGRPRDKGKAPIRPYRGTSDFLEKRTWPDEDIFDMTDALVRREL